MEEELDPGNIRNTQPHNAMPFVVALVGFLIVATLAFVFLRDEDLTLARPVAIETVDERTVVVTEVEGAECPRFERAQVDLAEDEIFLEFAVREDDDCPDIGIRIVVELPEPIGDREVVPGIGRLQLPCDSSGRCRAEQ